MLASLFPIIAVMLLALYVSSVVTPEEIITLAATVDTATSVIPWHEKTPGLEVVLGIRAIIPLVLFLLFVMVFVLKEKVQKKGDITYGITLCVLGMIVFNVGLS